MSLEMTSVETIASLEVGQGVYLPSSRCYDTANAYRNRTIAEKVRQMTPRQRVEDFAQREY